MILLVKLMCISFYGGLALPKAFGRLELRYGGLAQLARAPALHAGGHRFDSDILHNGKIVYS